MDETPLEPLFEVIRLMHTAPYWFARVQISIAPEDPELGNFTAYLDFPIRVPPGTDLQELCKQVLHLARQTVNVSAILPSLRACK